MGEAKRRKKLNPDYGKPTSQNDPIGTEENYECYGERAEYFRDLDFYLNQGGAFEESLPRYHKYRSVTESQLFQFIQNAIDREEQTATYILNKVKSLSDLTEIQSDLLSVVDKSIMSKRSGDLNQAFKYYDQVFSHNQTWFMLWYGLAKLLCLFREYRMAFACIKICTYLYPKMWNGRQYHSDHNLSYHYDQIYSLAIAGEENESYLKTLGRPLDTIIIADSNGKVIANSPVGKIKVVKPESLSSDIKTQVQGDSHNMNALAYNNRGAVRSELGDKKGAITDYNKAIELQPDLAQAYYNRGLVRSE
ncbi:tetratricopeptide repeat protein, partial [Microcoleus sp. D3_18_C2]|uniref:tetratricopeptide repeat protein n=1 Tax=Microcoleus sp. D3_18_C2 TaxID=3055334 RepID=UPI002FCEEFF2